MLINDLLKNKELFNEIYNYCINKLKIVCNCSDCGGDEKIIECKIEKKIIEIISFKNLQTKDDQTQDKEYKEILNKLNNFKNQLNIKKIMDIVK